MWLVIISSEFPPGPGGIGNHAHQLALNLHRLGWEVTIISPQDYASGEEAERFNSAQPFRVIHVPSGRGRLREAFHRLGVACRLAREHKPNVLLGSGLSGVWVAAALGAIRRLPSAAVAHGSEFGMKRGISRAINRWAYHQASTVIAVSQFTRGVMERAGIRPRRIEVIPNAADHRRFTLLPETERQSFRQKAGFNGASLMLTVGHVSERKGQEVVIRALPHIARRVPDIHYLMIGLPTLQEQLTQLAEQLGVRDRVHFLGVVTNDDMVRWLNCADVFVMTSCTTPDGDCEGFGIAVVEAALCGKPAVVSAQSGLIEAIQDGVTGFAVPERDATAMAEAVISLLTDPTRCQTMGAAAWDRAMREQTWETCARKYDALLRQIAK
jgi:phosphatidylinositol alpha-1,6-mannosyltransferase